MPLWIADGPLILASRSEVRSKILAAAGLRFETWPAGIDERAVEAEANVADAEGAARFLARAKANAVAKDQPGRLVLGADQTLARGGLRFSKPANRAASGGVPGSSGSAGGGGAFSTPTRSVTLVIAAPV